MTGALEGVRIADFSRVLAAPYATMLLADLGAEVIKVERPDGGDETRHWGPPWHEGESTYFLSVNRNKTSRVVDLRTDEGRAEALELIDSCDVLAENFRAGTMEKLGLGYDELSRRNPQAGVLLGDRVRVRGRSGAAGVRPHRAGRRRADVGDRLDGVRPDEGGRRARRRDHRPARDCRHPRRTAAP